MVRTPVRTVNTDRKVHPDHTGRLALPAGLTVGLPFVLKKGGKEINMTSLLRRPVDTRATPVLAGQSKAPAVAQCCAKISVLVAGCHD